jgi:hypothetical protein
MTAAARAAVERLAELNNKLAVVVVNAELLAGGLDPADVAERTDRTLRAAWEAAGIAQDVARGLLGEPPLAGVRGRLAGAGRGHQRAELRGVEGVQEPGHLVHRARAPVQGPEQQRDPARQLVRAVAVPPHARVDPDRPHDLRHRATLPNRVRTCDPPAHGTRALRDHKDPAQPAVVKRP